MPKLFLKELLKQLEFVDECIQEIKNRGFTDVWGVKIRPADRDEYKTLMERRRELREKIIHFEP